MVLDDSLGNSGEGDVEILRQCPQHHERAGGVDVAALDQNTLGLAMVSRAANAERRCSSARAAVSSDAACAANAMPSATAAPSKVCGFDANRFSEPAISVRV